MAVSTLSPRVRAGERLKMRANDAVECRHQGRERPPPLLTERHRRSSPSHDVTLILKNRARVRNRVPPNHDLVEPRPSARVPSIERVDLGPKLESEATEVRANVASVRIPA